MPRDDVHLSFRLWYEGVASSNKGAGGGRSPVVANTVELQKKKKNDNKTVAQLDGYCQKGLLTRTILSLNFDGIDRKAVVNLLNKTSNYLCCLTAILGIFRHFPVLHCSPPSPYHLGAATTKLKGGWGGGKGTIKLAPHPGMIGFCRVSFNIDLCKRRLLHHVIFSREKKARRTKKASS